MARVWEVLFRYLQNRPSESFPINCSSKKTCLSPSSGNPTTVNGGQLITIVVKMCQLRKLFEIMRMITFHCSVLYWQQLATNGIHYGHFVIHCCIFYTFINSYFTDIAHKRGLRNKKRF